MTRGRGASFAPSPVPQRIALVVDSGTEINELLDGVLASENWSVQRVHDNCAALTTVAANSFELIITGSKNRCTEDLEVVHKIRAARPHARLIILADKFTPGDVLDAMREGAFSYFSGPFEHAALVDMVRKAIDSPCWMTGSKSSRGRPLGSDWRPAAMLKPQIA